MNEGIKLHPGVEKQAKKFREEILRENFELKEEAVLGNFFKLSKEEIIQEALETVSAEVFDYELSERGISVYLAKLKKAIVQEGDFSYEDAGDALIEAFDATVEDEKNSNISRDQFVKEKTYSGDAIHETKKSAVIALCCLYRWNIEKNRDLNELIADEARIMTKLQNGGQAEFKRDEKSVVEAAIMLSLNLPSEDAKECAIFIRKQLLRVERQLKDKKGSASGRGVEQKQHHRGFQAPQHTFKKTSKKSEYDLNS